MQITWLYIGAHELKGYNQIISALEPLASTSFTFTIATEPFKRQPRCFNVNIAPKSQLLGMKLLFKIKVFKFVFPN